MFYGSLVDKGSVLIVDATKDEFEAFLLFFYDDKITITEENVAKMMYLAKKYEVDGCLNICDRYLDKNLPFENIWSDYELAVVYERAELQEKFEKKMIEKERVLSTLSFVEFTEISRGTLKKALEMDFASHPKEMFDACMNWAAIKCFKDGEDSTIMENYKNALGECFYLLPFPLMDAGSVAECVSKHRELFDGDELAELLMIAASNTPINPKIFKRKVLIPTIGAVTPWKCREYRYKVGEDNSTYKFDVKEKCRFVGLHIPFFFGFYSNDPIGSLTVTSKPLKKYVSKNLVIDASKCELIFDEPIDCEAGQYTIVIEYEKEYVNRIYYLNKDWLELYFDFDVDNHK